MSKQGKVGIVTLHYGFNEGAILQAYCLSRAIASLGSGWPVEVIDHRYPSKVAAYGAATTGRTRSLASAIEKWLPLSRQRFASSEEKATFDYINSNYSSLVVGSDQVWGMRFRKKIWHLAYRQPGGFHPPVPNVYFPTSDVSIPKIAYAASVGASDWSSMPRKVRREILRSLESFGALSVRDRRTMSFLEWLSPDLSENACFVPDPTRIFSVIDPRVAHATRRKLARLGVNFAKENIAIVGGGGVAIDEYIARRRGADTQIVGFSYECPGVDVDLSRSELSPLEWAHAFGLFSLCITERMHASIYCSLNKTPVIAVDINENVEGAPTKLQDFFTDIGHPSFCIPKSTASYDDIARLESVIREGGWSQDNVDLANHKSRTVGLSFLSAHVS